MIRAAIFALALLAVPTVVEAQSLEEIDHRDAAVFEAWETTPLTVRRAVFVSEQPVGFGQYAERPDNVFKVGEKLTAYVEPIGYGWKDGGDGQYEFGFAVDFLLKSPDGKVLAGQQDFAAITERSHVRNREFMVVLTLNVTGAPPGEYRLEYKLRDVTGPKSATFTLPFKIVK